MVAENRFVALSVTEEITFPLCCVCGCVFMRSQQYSNSTATRSVLIELKLLLHAAPPFLDELTLIIDCI